jgi:hypothetical protein
VKKLNFGAFLCFYKVIKNQPVFNRLTVKKLSNNDIQPNK